MGKKKKGSKRNDARGYGTTSQPSQQRHPPPPSTSTAATTTKSKPLLASQAGAKINPKSSATTGSINSSSSKTLQVSAKTHDDLLQLLGQLTSEQEGHSKYVTSMAGGGSSTTTSSPTITTHTPPPRFASRLATIVDRLEEMKIADPQIAQVVVALGYSLSTLEMALDWLCLNVPSSDLPPLLTEQQVRDKQLQHPQQDDRSLTVMRFQAPSTTKVSSNTSNSIDTERIPINTYTPAATQSQEQSPSGQNVKKKDSVSKEEEEEAAARKAWLLAQYQYEENDYDALAGTKSDPQGQGAEHGASETTVVKEQSTGSQKTETDKPALSLSSPTPSPQELQLAELLVELRELEADLYNDANNYMRSKQETKQLTNDVKKLKQQVSGLQKKVDRQKAKQQEEQQSPTKDACEQHDNQFELSASLFGNSEEDEEEQEDYGGGLFDMPVDSNKDMTDVSATRVSTPAANSLGATSNNSPAEPIFDVDYSIPKGWTGTTPQKTLNEWYQKRQKGKQRTKLPKPKYHKLAGSGGNKKKQGYRLVIARESGNTTEPLEFKQDYSNNFRGNVQEYLALQALYSLEPTMPLYQLFPPVFRTLWLSWVDHVQQEVNLQKEDIAAAQTRKMDRLLALIAESVPKKTAGTTSNHTSGKEKKAPTADGTQTADSDLLDSWEDQDYDEIALVQTEQPSSTTSATANHKMRRLHATTTAEERLRDEFIQRQSTHEYQEMKKVRTALPMNAYRETVLKSIVDHPVTIICAETGAGKTTQVPQYCLEDALLNGQGDSVQMICTQPRRVAATSVAERVAEEMCEPRGVGSLVGYQIRMEARRSSSTRLLFCTTGVVIRRLQDDATLSGVTHVLVDEVHERQQQTDVLLIALRRLLRTSRPDLKIILMSATLDSELFCSFFYGAPLISVPGRTFPVSSYFLEDLMDATDHHIEEGSRCAIREDRNGGLKAALWVTNRGGEKRKEVVDLVSQVDVGEVSDLYPGYKMSTRRSMDRVNEQVINYDLIEDILHLLLVQPDRNSTLLPPEGADLSKGSVLVFLPGLFEIRSMMERLEASRTFGDSSLFQILPLHSTLSSRDQRKAFVPSKPGCRKLILSTNIAETSVTIPDVVVVIDLGRVREVRQNKRTSTSTLVTDWCSKASTKQRAGRAGRVQPGICLKLYSSRTASLTMKETSEPELRRVPLEEVCLSILASGFATIGNGGCLGFLNQAPQPPAEASVKAALQVLSEVGAITIADAQTGTCSVERLTPLGHHLSKLPVDVRLGKMLVFGSLFRCIDKVLTIAACLSSDSLFSNFVGTDGNVAKAKQQAFADSKSDFMTLCNVWEAYREVTAASGESAGRKFCRSNYLNYNALREIRNAREHFSDLLATIGFLDRSIACARSKQRDNVELAKSIYNENGNKVGVVHAVICAGLYPNVSHLTPSSASGPLELWHKQERLFVHSSSVHSDLTKPTSFSLAATIKQNQSSWICFHEKFATPNRVSISTACFVHPFALILFGGSVVVKHVDRKVIVDDWIEIGLAAQTGVMMRALRHQLDLLLQEMINRPTQNPSSQTKAKKDLESTMVNGIIQLLLS